MGIKSNIVESSGSPRLIINNTPTGDYTLVDSDHGKQVIVDANITIPAGLADNFSCSVFLDSSTSKTITTSAITLKSNAGSLGARGLTTIRSIATDEFIVDVAPDANAIKYAGHITGYLTGCEITIDAVAGQVNMTEGDVIIINHTDPLNASYTPIHMDAIVDRPITDIATSLFTQFAIDIAGDLKQNPDTLATPEYRRNNVILDAAVHANGVDITDIAINSIQAFQPTEALVDVQLKKGITNEGNSIVSGGANLTVQKLVGASTLPFVGTRANPQNPATIPDLSQQPLTRWTASRRNGSGGFVFTDIVTTVDPDNYDANNILDQLDPVPNNKWTIRFFHFFTQNKSVVMVYGQAIYNSAEEALIGIGLENPENPEFSPFLETGVHVTALIVKKGVTDLDAAVISGNALFRDVFTTGGSSGGGSSDTSLAKVLDINDTSTGSYTLLSTDIGKLVHIDNTLVIPTGLPIGFQCSVFLENGTAQTLTTTGNTTKGKDVEANISGNGIISIAVIDTDEILITGQMEA